MGRGATRPVVAVSGMKVLVRWKKQGQLIEEGVATSRGPGDEDLVERKYAESMERAGKVTVLGPWEQFACKRTVARVPKGVTQ